MPGRKISRAEGRKDLEPVVNEISSAVTQSSLELMINNVARVQIRARAERWKYIIEQFVLMTKRGECKPCLSSGNISKNSL